MKWQPIETAPKDKLILVGRTKRMDMCTAVNHSQDGWVTETPAEWISIYTPSHWMPLPAAPGEKCRTCSGHGAVGNILTAEPCPDCTPAAAAPSAHVGLLAAAAHIRAKAQAHLDELGNYDPDTGAVEMSESNQEHFNTLDELAEEIRLMAEKAAPASCDKPPAGWTCSRAPGHDGPCVAAPAAPAVDAETIHLQDLKNALAECQELRQQLMLMDEQQAGSIWRWQADDQDQIETMGNRMGVLIYACDLRALLARAAPAVDAAQKALRNEGAA